MDTSNGGDASYTVWSYYYPQDKPKSKPKVYEELIPTRIIINDRTTICYFPDGEKIIVRCAEYEEFEVETAVSEAIAKKAFGGNRSAFLRVVDQAYYQPNEKKKKYKYDSNF
jgi:hypothetical protein